MRMYFPAQQSSQHVIFSLIHSSKMWFFSQVAAISLCFAQAVLCQSSDPGYFTNFSTMPKNNSISFGRHYAVLNLDIINDVTKSISTTPSGSTWLSCLQTWVDAVNAQNPKPLTFWTRIYYENSHYPDVKPGSPLSGYLASAGVVVAPGAGNPNASIQNQQLEASPLTQIWDAFVPVNGSDIVLEKTRFYAGFGNNLEHILAAQSIDTVILVCLEKTYLSSTIS